MLASSAQSLAQLDHASKRLLVKLGLRSGTRNVCQRSRRLSCLITRVSATPVTGMGVAQTLSYSQREAGISSYSI